ncbi:MAG: hypothetical protein N2247_00435 [Leptospiraceae bacterium]|nr:hypothetical protein [Leptospiraceae bacterium]
MKKYLLWFFIFVNVLHSQIIKSPSEVIDIQRINRIKDQYQNNLFNEKEILPIIDQELQNYFKQFRDERLLKDTVVSIPYDFYEFPLNKIHTLIYIRNQSDIQKSRIFSPYLYQTFFLKAQLHQKLGENQKAIQSYLQALNYSIPILEQEKTIMDASNKILPENLLIIDLENTLNKDLFKKKLDYFEYLNYSMGDKNFQIELSDNNLKYDIQQFQKNYRELQKQLETIKNIKQEYYKLDLNKQVDLNYTTNKQNQLKNFENTWKQIISLWNDLLTLEQSLLNEQEKLKKEYAEILYNIALLIKGLEQKNKERERMLNQSSYYRGTGNTLGVNKTLYSDFVGYKQLLEMAHNLEPQNLLYLDKLSDEYFRDKNIQVGLKIEKSWFSLAQKNDERNPKHYFRIISYYLTTKNISLAKEYLEQFYQDLNNYPNLRQYLYEDKNLFLEPMDHFLYFYQNFYLTNYTKLDDEVIKDLLKKTENKLSTIQNISESSKGLKMKYHLLEDLSKYYRIKKNYPEEFLALTEILNLDKKLKESIQELEIRKKSLEKEASELKQKLYYEENTELSQKLFRLEKVDLPNVIYDLQSLITLKKSIPIGNVLERLAYLSYQKNDLNAAIDYYNQMLEDNFIDTNYKKRAVNNIKNLKKTLEAGYKYKIELPDTFER